MSILEIKSITKVFPGTVALKNVSMEFISGSVHAFVGKNGSGKSTLMKIIAGSIQQTEGECLLDGKPIDNQSPKYVLEQGIVTVYQELSIIKDLSVTENILLGRLPIKNKFVNWGKAHQIALNILDEIGINISPKSLVRDLSIGQQQMVEIARAMSYNARVLLLDEPTSSLSLSETNELFRLINKLKQKGVIVVYITHRLHELWQVADTCSVLRDGHYIGTVPLPETDRKVILNMMFGDMKINERPKDIVVEDEIVLETKNLGRNGVFQNISFQLKKGEILGIAGMLGSKRTELLRSIFGAEPFDTGELIVNGKRIDKPSPRLMKENGIAMIQEDRAKDGLSLSQSIKQNINMASIERSRKGPFVSRRLEIDMSEKRVRDLNIKISSIEDPISSLSGGNQQKTIIGRWLNTEPKIMLFDEPSRGVDVESKQQIFKIIWDLSRQGISTIMVSSELEELLECCSRIIVMRDGRTCAEVNSDEIPVDQLYSACMGKEK